MTLGSSWTAMVSAVAGALLTAACGGSGGGGGGATAVRGVVVSNDGSSAAVGGIDLELLASGSAQAATTDAGGRFDFGTVARGTWHLGLEDDDEDDGKDVEIEGDEIEIKLELENGVVVKVEVSSEDGLEAKIELARSDESDDPDVEGTAKIEIQGVEQEFEVEAEHLDPGREVEAFLIQEGVETSLGVRTADDGGEAEWKFENGDLPLDVATVEDLEGLRIEVRDAATGTVLLFGEIPELPLPLDTDDEQEVEVKALLTPAAGVEGRAVVELEQETEDGETESEIEFEAEDLTLAQGTVLVVLLEDPAALGTLVEIGTMTVDSEGEAELEFELEEGGLPFGALSLDELFGLAVEIRVQSTNDLLFSGAVPSF